MGREEKMTSTKFVPAKICWLAYICACTSVYVTFHYPLVADQFWNGFAAHMVSTVVIWIFSCTYSNTSIYDPFWCYMPLAISIGWMATNAASSVSTRSCVAFVLLLVWCVRYARQFPWTGWFTGLHHEDWRYVQIAKQTGSGTVLYWFASLISLHLTPTCLVFAGLSPMEREFSRTAATSIPINNIDVAGVVVCVTAIAIQHFADTTLFQFRTKVYGTNTGLDYKSTSKKICTAGLWRWSRHPNYFGESFFWFGIALLARAGESGDGAGLFRAWFGAVVMLLFFRVSAYLTDQRMLKNRGAKYQKVMDTTSPLILFPTWLP